MKKKIGCKFCKEEVVEKGHITQCTFCGGDLHNREKVSECACCGKKFPISEVTGKPDTSLTSQSDEEISRPFGPDVQE